MGLAISVGLLPDYKQHDSEGAEGFRKQVESVNTILKENGLTTFTEPESLMAQRGPSETSFPYSFLHYLRRVCAFQREGLDVTPIEKLTQRDHDIITDTSTLFDSHLLCHSDCSGFYVPIDFADPIFDDRVPGTMLGSSPRLLRELIQVAPVIGVEVADGKPTEAAIQALRTVKDGSRFWRERIVWLTLYEAATFSIAHSTMIVFH